MPDEQATYIPPPQFEEAIYRGSLNVDGQLSSEEPKLKEDTFSDGLSFSVSGDDGDLFSVGLLPPYSVAVSLKSPITEENVAGKTFLTATISATHPEGYSGSTVLLIDLPNVPVVTTPKPTFEKSLVRGSINSGMELSIETVVLIENTYSSDVTFSMSGGNLFKTKLRVTLPPYITSMSHFIKTMIFWDKRTQFLNFSIFFPKKL